MNPILSEIDEVYRKIDRYMEPRDETRGQLSTSDLVELKQNFRMSQEEYKFTIDRMSAVLPNLTPDDLIEGYLEGSYLLQKGIAGYIGRHFNPIYVPMMVEAIKSSHANTAWAFLQILADNLGNEVAPLVIEALDNQSLAIREKALSIAAQLRLVEAIPKIQLMTGDEIQTISFLAKQVLGRLNNKDK